MSIALSLPGTEARSWTRTARVYFALTKPRIIVLLEITTVLAMVMAYRGWPSTWLVLTTVAGGALAAGSANTLNCWFDRDIDATMGRTRHRPLPSGRIGARAAVRFGIVLGILSFVLLALTANVLAAVLALAANVFYVGIYTAWLKRSSVHNIVIGGAAGAVPPLVGWAAVTGHLDVTALFLFAIIFYWTPPHFWALALLIRSDYARARVPMLPVVGGDRFTRQQIVLYTIVLILVTVLPVLTHSFGAVYAVGAAVLDLMFLGGAVRVVHNGTARAARQLFYYSMLYLALLFAVMAADRVLLG